MVDVDRYNKHKQKLCRVTGIIFIVQVSPKTKIFVNHWYSPDMGIVFYQI
jgi:hypothetical protein